MRKVSFFAAGILLAACAAEPLPVEREPMWGREAPSPPAATVAAVPVSAGSVKVAETAAGDQAAVGGPLDPGTIDPSSYAKRFHEPAACERAARAIQTSSHDKAWSVLKACVAKGNFTLLDKLVDASWLKDLQTRPDAPKLVAKVISSRGGDVTRDLTRMRQNRIPLFPLSAALRQPELYRGRMVLLRARVGEARNESSGQVAVSLSEVAFNELPPDPMARFSRSIASVRMTTLADTGLQAIGRFVAADPFFEPGGQFVVLGRLDGIRETRGAADERGERIALLTIVGYFEPTASTPE